MSRAATKDAGSRGMCSCYAGRAALLAIVDRTATEAGRRIGLVEGAKREGRRMPFRSDWGQGGGRQGREGRRAGSTSGLGGSSAHHLGIRNDTPLRSRRVGRGAGPARDQKIGRRRVAAWPQQAPRAHNVTRSPFRHVQTRSRGRDRHTVHAARMRRDGRTSSKNTFARLW